MVYSIFFFIILYEKIIVILEDIFRYRFILKYWHFVFSIPKSHLKFFYFDKHNNLVKSLLTRALYFPKINFFNKKYFKKLDNYVVNNLIRRFEYLWVYSIYPYIYKWLFIPKYKRYWRNLFLNFTKFGEIAEQRKKFLITKRFRNSLVNTKKKRKDDLFMKDYETRERKRIINEVSLSYRNIIKSFINK